MRTGEAERAGQQVCISLKALLHSMLHSLFFFSISSFFLFCYFAFFLVLASTTYRLYRSFINLWYTALTSSYFISVASSVPSLLHLSSIFFFFSQRVSGLPVRYSPQSFLHIFPAVLCLKWGQGSISQWIAACFHSLLPLSWFIAVLIAPTYSNVGVCLGPWVHFEQRWKQEMLLCLSS